MKKCAPAMFIGHGSPMFALSPGRSGELLKQFSHNFDEVRAVLVISAHWMSRGLQITAADQLETIHDFYGFPAPLYQMQYQAPGSQVIAEEIVQHLETDSMNVELNYERGRDHGAWTPMIHLLPEMKLPVLQLSLDRTLGALGLLKLGESLKVLRESGVAIIASGSLTHNLYEVQQQTAPVAPYAERFQNWVRDCVEQGDIKRLSYPQDYTEDFKRAHPTDEHYLPLLIAMGATDQYDQLQILAGGVENAVISMESYGWVST